MENCFFRLHEDLKRLDAFSKDGLYKLRKDGDFYNVEWCDKESGMIEQGEYEKKFVEQCFEEGDWIAVSLEKDENKPCWNCKHLDDLVGCNLNEGVCPVWIEADETDNFKCFERE